MDFKSEDFERLFEVFKTECGEHLQVLNRALISLEALPDQPDLLSEIFRAAHSLKGAARMIQFTSIEKIAHQIETLLGRVNQKETTLSREVNDLILKGLDTIDLVLQTVSEGGTQDEVDVAEISTKLEGACKTPRSADKKSASKKGKMGADQRDLKLFSEESRADCKALLLSLRKIEQNPDSNDIKVAYEKAHALKGNARMIKHAAMDDLACSIENYLHAVLEQVVSPSSSAMHCLLTAVNFIETFIHQIESKKRGKTPPRFNEVLSEMNRLSVPTQVFDSTSGKNRDGGVEKMVASVIKKSVKKNKKTVDDKSKTTVRVNSEKLDSLMGQAGELLVLKLKARQRLMDAQTIIDDYSGLSKEIKIKMAGIDKTERRHIHLAEDKKNQQAPDIKIAGRLSFISDRLEFFQKSLFDDFRQFSIIIERLQDDVRKTRLFPFQTVLDVFPRMVRDLSLVMNKKITLETSGGNIELDKYILEEIKDPMMHIIRNCLDHGIELPAERIKLGKTETGLIRIAVTHKGNDAVITVTDDGKGIDLERIKASAIRRGIYNEAEMNLMKEKQILNLIFHPGFSTSTMITDISGRGVGMDVVKANIEKLNGVIDIETVMSQGSTFIMTVPLTLSTTQSLKILAGGEVFFLPVNMVERIIKVSESALPFVEGHPAVHYSGSYIPYVRLSSVLEVSEPRSEHALDVERPVAILKTGKTLAAFGLDGFLGEEEILMKGLGPYMKRIRNISGVTIMRDGAIAPVLNVTDMMNTVLLRELVPLQIKKENVVQKVQISILVVDDSVMTRTLAKNILESYGYRVLTAVDGEDGLSKLQNTDIDIVVSDVQMPNMDGLEFTRHIRQSKRFSHIPVILVSALESSEDKKKGVEVGADAYIIKSAFDQSNLISTIKSLVTYNPGGISNEA